MKLLVAGSVPPPATGHRAALLEDVVRLRRQGHEVEVLSLDHEAAAHRYIPVPGLPAALEVGLAGRGFDAVVVQIEPGLPVRARAGRGERAVSLLLLAALLRRLPQVTLRWDGPDDLPGGPGGRAAQALWRAATRIELGEGIDSDAVADLLPDGRSRLSFVRPTAPAPIVAPDVEWSAGAPVSASRVNEIVRRRAAATRQALGNASRRPQEGVKEGVRVEQWQWLPAPELGVPDLGPLRKRQPGPTTRSVSMHSLAARALGRAERYGVTRPAAQLARLALSEFRRASRAR